MLACLQDMYQLMDSLVDGCCELSRALFREIRDLIVFKFSAPLNALPAELLKCAFGLDVQETRPLFFGDCLQQPIEVCIWYVGETLYPLLHLFRHVR